LKNHFPFLTKKNVPLHQRKNFIPGPAGKKLADTKWAIGKIIEKHHVPTEQYQNLPVEEKRKINEKKQEEINELFIKKQKRGK
jgi:hypothetical protein